MLATEWCQWYCLLLFIVYCWLFLTHGSSVLVIEIWASRCKLHYFTQETCYLQENRKTFGIIQLWNNHPTYSKLLAFCFFVWIYMLNENLNYCKANKPNFAIFTKNIEKRISEIKIYTMSLQNISKRIYFNRKTCCWKS